MSAGDKERLDLITILRSTSATLNALLAGVGEQEARRGTGVPDEWSTAEIVAHLVDAEQAWLTRRIRLMAEEQRPTLRYYPDEDYSKPALRESLAEFERLRESNVVYLESLPAAAWKRHGTHQRWGDITITWAVRHIAAHDAEHLAQLSRSLPLAQ
jgi:DinB superfamily